MKNYYLDKEMWITEWNIANPANRVANTQLHAMYVRRLFSKNVNDCLTLHKRTFMLLPVLAKDSPCFRR